MNRSLHVICLEFMHREQDASGLCVGCHIFTKNKICPLYSPEKKPVNLKREQQTNTIVSLVRDKPLDTQAPLMENASVGKVPNYLPTDAFKTACPDYIVSGNMQLEEEYFGGRE